MKARKIQWIQIVPAIALVLLGAFHFWPGWYIWGTLLFIIRFFRFIPIYNADPLDRSRRATAVATAVIFLLSFMPAPFTTLG